MQKLANFLIAFGLCLCLPNLLMAQPVQSVFPPNQLLIKFQPGTPTSTINRFLSDYNAVQLGISPVSEVRLWQVLGFPTPGNFSNITEIIANANTKPEVTGAGGNYQVDLQPYANTGTAQAWDQTGICGYNLTCPSGTQLTNVVIMDTGTDYGCSDLAARFLPNDPGYDFVNGDAEPYDDHGHGTHITGLIDRVVRLTSTDRVRFFSYKTHDQTGKGELFNVILAVDRAIEEGMHIINMSFAYYAAAGEKQQSSTLSLTSQKSAPLQIAIDIAAQHGILVLAASGNNSQNNDTANSPALPASFPCPNIISIASGNCNQQLSSFSNWGPQTVDIVAPGENLEATEIGCYPGFRTGTSQAAAIVSGVATILGTHFSNQFFDYRRVKCAILSGAVPSSTFSNKVSTQGVINAPNAFQSFFGSNCNTDGPIKTSRAPSNTTFSVFPNPFEGALRVRFMAERTAQAQVSIWDVQGKQVFAQNWTVDPGPQEISWEPAGQTPGVYTVRVALDGAVYTSKAVLLR